MRWAAYTDSWHFDIHTSVWLTGNDAASYPPNGILPILLVDDEVIGVKVVSASPSAIVIERDGCRWRLSPAVSGSSVGASRFPGSEWIITARLKKHAPARLGLVVSNTHAVPLTPSHRPARMAISSSMNDNRDRG